MLNLPQVAAIKAGSEDWKRHREDARTNCSTAHLVAPDGSVRHLAWRDVRVGQVLQVFDGEQVPADLLCLATGLEEGVCFVRTTNLVRAEQHALDSRAPAAHRCQRRLPPPPLRLFHRPGV